MSDDAEQAPKLELMRMDLSLKTKQAFWETPHNIAILVATVAAVAGALGYKFGQQPQQPPVVIYVPAPGGAATVAPSPVPAR